MAMDSGDERKRGAVSTGSGEGAVGLRDVTGGRFRVSVYRWESGWARGLGVRVGRWL